MRIAITTVALVAATALMGCTQERPAIPSPSVNLNEIFYFKDPRTDLCFAALPAKLAHVHATSTSITHVPCTSAVMSQVVNAMERPTS